jgi:hypothetical protein
MPAVNLLINPDFEDGAGGWTEAAEFVGTSFWRGGSAQTPPKSGDSSYTISNLAYGWLESDPVDVLAGEDYHLTAWARGEVDTDESNGGVYVRAVFYDAGGDEIDTADVFMDPGGSLSKSWRQVGGLMTIPAGATDVVVRLGSLLTNGWVAFDDVELEWTRGGGNLVANSGFEDGETGWIAVAHGEFPATSIRLNDDNTSDGRGYGNGHAWAISNHAHGKLVSDRFPVDSNTEYDLYVWVRGESDSEASWKALKIKVIYYRYYRRNWIELDDETVYSNSGSVGETWKRVGDRVVTASNYHYQTYAEIHLEYRFASGWIAFDGVEMVKVGQSSNAVPNPGFENGAANWSEDPREEFPATAFWLSRDGIAEPHGGGHAFAISNLGNGRVLSDPIEVVPDTDYDMGVWVRGSVDPDDSLEELVLRADFYDSGGGWLGAQGAFVGDRTAVIESWSRIGGIFTTPPGCAEVVLGLENRFFSGWVAFDDVELVEVR